MSSSLYLVHMANDIGNFFCAQQSRELAITDIANHMTSYWTRRIARKTDSRKCSTVMKRSTSCA